MNERQSSVLFGVPMPEPGILTAGQRWTAALAVLLAALLLVSTDGGRTLLSAPPSTGTPAAGASPAPTPSATVAPAAPIATPTLPGAPPPSPTFELGSPAPAPEPSADPEPAPAPSGDDQPPPEDEEPAACPVPVAAVLAGAGLCPPD